MDGGARMVRVSNFKSFCMVALLVAEATQAVTPDIASLASSRLFQIVAALAAHGESLANPRLNVACRAIHTEQAPPPSGSAPFGDQNEESAPDEVCLASCQPAFQLPVDEAGNAPMSHHLPLNLVMLSLHPGRSVSSYASLPVPRGPALIHSLCRMTC